VCRVRVHANVGEANVMCEGGNLLHLLEKHGQPARLDLRETKIRLVGEEKASVPEERLK
jgi:hypothetical protein